MSKFKEELDSKVDQYRKISILLDSKKQNSIDGRLEIKIKNDNAEYYLVKIDNESKKRVRKYISTKNPQLAKQLAQESYEKKLKKLVNKRIKQFDNLKDFSENELDEVYYSLKSERRDLVIPIIPTNKQKLEEWKSEEVFGSIYQDNMPDFYTKKGERVRSKSEAIIADRLYDNSIEYKYEKPLKLGSDMIFPDFTIYDEENNKEIYWEHFGIMDNEDYLNRTLNKIEKYIQEDLIIGQDVIFTFESSKHQLNFRTLDKLIQNMIK